MLYEKVKSKTKRSKMKLENFIKNNNLVLASEFTKANSTQFNKLKSIFRQQSVKNLTIFRFDKKDGSDLINREFLRKITKCESV